MPADRSKFIPASKIRREYDISIGTLHNWSDSGKTNAIRLAGGKRLYDKESLDRLLTNTTKAEEKAKARIGYIYCRVSSSHQKEDLKRQIESLKCHFPNYEVISDIASGLNWQRKGLKTLLDRVHNGDVTEIVVAHKDRLCRFGFELVQYFCEKSDCKVVVYHTRTEEPAGNSYNELAEDLLAVTNYFVAKNNGLRAARNRKDRKEKAIAERESGSCYGRDREGMEDQNEGRQEQADDN
jgi:predicted site-specific integrase-resolvase